MGEGFQILSSGAAFFFLAFLSKISRPASLVTTNEFGGTLCMRKTFAPMVVP
jgi:hypothetical protein